MIKYINDNDLEFLSKVKSEDLNDLVYRLTHDQDDTLMLTEELISHELYKKYYPDHHKYWQLIAAEIQRFGANTFSTLLRGGEGVKYREVLMDVCDRLKVNYNKDSKIERIEDGLLMKILADMVEKMSQEELKKFAEEAGFDSFKRLTPEMMIGFF